MLFDSNGTESSGCNVSVQVHTERWFVCDSKNHGLCVAQITPSIAARELPKTHADAGSFLFLQAAELSRDQKKEIVVVQQSLSPFSMALIAAIWNGSCMKARLGTAPSNKVQTGCCVGCCCCGGDGGRGDCET